MRTILAAATLSILTFSSSIARADGLFYQLPEDGAWVEFEVMAEEQGPKGPKRESTGSLRVSSVGTTTVEGKKCRWIEFESVTERDNREPRTQIWKILVPEKRLQQGETPREHILKVWAKRGDGPAREIDKAHMEVLQLFFVGPLKGEKPLDAEIIETGLGKLRCVGLTGEVYIEPPKGVRGADAAISATFKTRLHEKAPFGVIWTTIDLTADDPQTGKLKEKNSITLKLTSHGTGAISELPDAK